MLIESAKQADVLADDATYWNAYLTSQLIGPQRATFAATLAQYSAGGLDQPAWEAAAASLGLHKVHIPYAEEPSVSAGAQLFVLASTLFGLGLVYQPRLTQWQCRGLARQHYVVKLNREL